MSARIIEIQSAYVKTSIPYHDKSDDRTDARTGEDVAPVMLVVRDASHRGEPSHHYADKLEKMSE